MDNVTVTRKIISHEMDVSFILFKFYHLSVTYL